MTDALSGMPLPAAFLQRLRQLFPSTALPALARSLTQPRQVGLRLNRLKLNDEACNNVAAWLTAMGGEVLPWFPTAYTLAPGCKSILLDSDVYRQGGIYIQNPASMLAPLALDVQPGQQILDLAAAPGGKTLLLAELTGGESRVAAVEAVKGRFFKMKANLRHYGGDFVKTYRSDGSHIWRKCPERFQRVLLDAPCSSEARITVGDESSYRYWSEKKIGDMSRKQKRLLFSAIQSTAPGGLVVYCTCSFAPEENEAVVDAMLRRFQGALEVIPIESDGLKTLPGITRWGKASYDARLANSLRLLPDETMLGFFLCKLKKTETTLAA